MLNYNSLKFNGKEGIQNSNEDEGQVQNYNSVIDNQNKEEVKDITIETKTGLVSDCGRLKVRVEPNINSEVICEISNDNVVLIDDIESTDDFYKVTTESGVDGFCMKKYIVVTE